VIENMDARKDRGRTADELKPVFDVLPAAGLCFDVAHAWSVDPSMAVGHELLNRYTSRLRHLHVSSISGDCQHEPLTAEHAELFAPLLSRCKDVPWILEAPLRES
jgi:sugar phosphate isomerase/epimerase